MTLKNKLASAAVLTLLVGSTIPAYAFTWGSGAQLTDATTTTATESTTASTQKHVRGEKGTLPHMQLSAEMQALMTQLRTAQRSGDTATVTSLKAQIKTQMETERAAREAALDTAIAGGYDTWHAYAVAQNMPTQLVSKITADNFGTYVQLRTAQKQVQDLQKQLGLTGPEGMGGGMMGGMGGGMMGGKMGGHMRPEGQEKQAPGAPSDAAPTSPAATN